jgi:ADP-heptose:LPS heptosyltransferase
MNVQSMLVIHQGALGDFILALPALENLRKAFPQAQSVMMGYPRILELVEHRFYADRIISIDQKGMASFFVKGGMLDQSLSNFFSTFDLVVMFGKDEKGVYTENLKRVCLGELLHLGTFPSWEERVHIIDHLLQQLVQRGLPVKEWNPRLFLNTLDQEWGTKFWKERGVTKSGKKEVIVLHPGSGSKKKVWPMERFLRLARILQEDLSRNLLIVLGPAEGAEVQKVFEEMEPKPPFFVKGLSLLQLASVMEGCRLFIGNDSGVSHMAVALGLPTLVLFGPTDPNVWSPRGKKVAVVRKEMPCSPCSQDKFFLCKNLKCLDQIEVGDVLRDLERMEKGVNV